MLMDSRNVHATLTPRATPRSSEFDVFTPIPSSSQPFPSSFPPLLYGWKQRWHLMMPRVLEIINNNTGLLLVAGSQAFLSFMK